MHEKAGADESPVAAKQHGEETDPLLRAKGGVSALGLGDWLGDLEQHFGFRLLAFLFVVQHLLKGFVNTLHGRMQPYLYKQYHVPGPQVQVFSGVCALPWSMKPFIGLASDAFPIGGLNKGPYIMMATLVGVAGYLGVGGIPSQVLPVCAVVICMFMMDVQASTCDLLSEALYADKISRCPSKGPDLLTFVWFGLQIGGLVATLVAGPVLHYLGPKAPYLGMAVPAFMVVVPVLMGYLGEKPRTTDDVAAARKRLFGQPELCALCLLTFSGTVVMTVVGLCFSSVKLNCVVGLTTVTVVLCAYSVVLSPMIARFAAFTLLQAVLDLNVGGAAFYFYTDSEKSYPEGPHFSEYFYTSVIGSVGSVLSLLGIWTYQRYMKTWRYRQLLLVMNMIYCVLSLTDAFFFSRLNLRLGIPDHVFLLGSTVFTNLVAQWKWMPTVVIISFLCPKGMEATMYALLAGVHNIGLPVSSTTGGLLLELLNCRPTGGDNESEQFKNLWVASLISSVLPLVTIVALFRLLPDARQDERLVDDPDFDGTQGSLWRRWTKAEGSSQVP